MSNVDFSTEATIEALTHEVTCLKATLTEMLKAMGQADAGKVIINMEKYAARIEDHDQSDAFKKTMAQIKHVYRQ